MKRTLKIVSICIALMMVFTAVIAMQTALFDAHAATIKISKTKVTLTKGKSTTLKITGTKSKPKWASGDNSIATVTSAGKVTAKKAGKATIIARVGKSKYYCTVTVKNPPMPNYKKLIVGGWCSYLETNEYVLWEFESTGEFQFTYYRDIYEEDPSNVISGKYTVSGNKLHIRAGNLKTTYTIKKLEENKSLIFSNVIQTYKLQPIHM